MNSITEFAGYKLVDLEYYHKLESVAAAAREFCIITRSVIYRHGALEGIADFAAKAKDELIQRLEELDE